jgi:hypothetical protein
MRGAVRPRVLAVAAACAACLVALGVVATIAVWGFRNGGQRSSTGVTGWLILLWVSVGIAVAIVVVIALVGVRALQRPLFELSRAANRLQVERLPMALRDIEAGTEPAPVAGISAPPELEGVAGALENLERFVHYHAKRAQRADRDLGRLLTGAADRVGARARLAEGIDLDPPVTVTETAAAATAVASLASGLHRDEAALRALVPDMIPDAGAEPPLPHVPGPSVSEVLTAAAQTTLRPSAVGIGELEPAIVDETASDAVVVVLGEVIDAAIGTESRIVVWGSVQPEGYHFVADAPVGKRSDELTHIAEALRERDPGHLPFGLRVAVQAGRRARLLVWLTVADGLAQWHVLVPPDTVLAALPAVVHPPVPPPEPKEAPRHAWSHLGATATPAVPPVEVPEESWAEPVVAEPVVEEPAVAESPVEQIVVSVEVRSTPEPLIGAAVNGTVPQADTANDAVAGRLADALANLFARLEIALERRAPDGPGLDEEERIALLVDGTRLVGKLQQAQLCSSQSLRALLRSIDVAVGADRAMPLAGSARGRDALPYEALTEIRARLGGEVDSRPPLP